jgi:hypothetical protein
MRNPLVLLIAFTFLFAFCTKKAAYVAKTTSFDTLLTTSGAFVAHTDTFMGLFKTQVGEVSFTSDSMIIGPFYVYHPTADSVVVSGNCICTEQLGTNGSATYYTYNNTFKFRPDSTGSYRANPLDHVYQSFRLSGDSLNISITSSPGSCLIYQLQTFAGKK